MPKTGSRKKRTMTQYTASHAKREFGDVLLNAQKGPVSITRNGKSVAVVMSAETYEALIGDPGAARESAAEAPARPSSSQVAAAAEIIDREARFLGLWDGAPAHDELDPVARAEYSGLVERILRAAAKTRR